MKKLLLFSALLIAGLTTNAQTAATKAQPASDQQVKDASAKASKQTDKMNAELGLTADQKSKVYNINLAKDKAIEINPEERPKLNEERKNEINAVLTPEQQVKFKKMLEDTKKASRESK